MELSKSEKRRLERRATIIGLARNYFFEHGYGATTMNAIAAGLGGSKATLWRHFSSKEELFAAVVEDTAAGIRGQIEFPRHKGDSLSTLTRLCRSIIDRGVSPEGLAMFRMINAEAGRFPELGRIFYERGPRKTQQMIGDYIATHFADELRDVDFDLAGQDLVALCTSTLYYEQLWNVEGPPAAKRRDAAARHAAAMFLGAYARDAARFAPIVDAGLGDGIINAPRMGEEQPRRATG